MELPTGDSDAVLDLPLDDNSKLPRSALIGPDQVSHAERSPVDLRFPVQLSLLDEALGLMQSLAITDPLPPNYTQLKLGAKSGEFCVPPTTHLIATVEDLTDMVDYATEDINGTDDDADAEISTAPPITRRWMATSTYDVYMVDTPDKKNDEDN